MADKSKIEWTEATWNPVAGCALVSPGCTHCYAMTVAARLDRMGQAAYAGLTRQSKAGPVWTGKIALIESALAKPLTWRRPRRIFVNSMSDLFHEDVPDSYIDKVFAVMALASQHTFQVLTKRADRMRAYCRRFALGHAKFLLNPPVADGTVTATWPLPNVWLGVSVEDQARADERIPLLLATPAAIRWISAEPLLGPVDLTKVRHQLAAESFMVGSVLESDDGFGLNAPRRRIDWVVAGGESGAGARPMHPDWARSLRDQCAGAGVPFFFKQWGEWAPAITGYPVRDSHRWPIASEGDTTMSYRVGKHNAGRTLDGRTHEEYPR